VRAWVHAWVGAGVRACVCACACVCVRVCGAHSNVIAIAYVFIYCCHNLT